MGFAETYVAAMTVAREPTLALAQTLDFKAIAKPWLLMLFQVIQATVPVLIRAADDAAEQWLADFYWGKFREERWHAAALLEDLEAAGIPHARSAPVNPFVAEMVGRQYYLIEFVHPIAYLGYIGLLEAFPPTLAQIDELERVSGLPSAAFRTARMHATVDVEHRKDLLAMLDAVPSEHHALILSNGIRCAQLQRLALNSLQEAPWPT